MINGFETQTHDLTTKEELTILPIIVCGLETKKGPSMAVTNSTIQKGLKALGHNVRPERIRAIISHVRINKLVPNLAANSNGCYIATDLHDLQRYIESLRQRARQINKVADSLEDFEQGELF